MKEEKNSKSQELLTETIPNKAWSERWQNKVREHSEFWGNSKWDNTNGARVPQREEKVMVHRDHKKKKKVLNLTLWKCLKNYLYETLLQEWKYKPRAKRKYLKTDTWFKKKKHLYSKYTDGWTLK